MTDAAAAAQAAPAKADPAATHVVSEWKHTSPLISCRFDPKGRFALTGAQDNTVLRWDLSTGKNVPLAAHDSWVRGLGFLPNGEMALTGGNDGRLIWWDVTSEKPQPTRKLDAHAGWLRSLSISPDGSLVATGGNDRLVKIWNTADGQLVRQMAGHTSHVYSTMFHPSGQFVLSGELRGVVHQWEVASGKLVHSFDAKELYAPNEGQGAEYGGVRSMSLSADAKRLACGGLYKASNPFGAVQDPLVLVFEWETQKKVQSHTGAGDLKGIIWRAVYHPDGFLIGGSGGSGGGMLLFWKPEQPNEFQRVALPNTIFDLDLHPDGLQLATVHHDRHLRISRMAPKQA